jgi:hypothetical protein
MMSALVPSPSPQAQALAKTNPVAGLRLGLWQGSINFYGEVVDESNSPIAGATATFHWVEEPSENGNRTASVETDSNGLFSLRDKVGLNLGVSVGKAGYYSSRRDNDSFGYGPLDGKPFPADQANPVIFHLRKKGQGVELVTSEHGIRLDVAARVPKGGTPVSVDFFQKQASPNGQLEITQIKPPWQTATNWSFRMSIPSGGCIENNDEFQFEAPESGYQPTVEYNFTKGGTNWTTQTTKRFYIVFGEPRKYGWLRIESNLAQETIFLTYAINPTGSRNLEPK